MAAGVTVGPFLRFFRSFVRSLGVVVRFTDVLDVVGLLCLVAFAYLIWPPAALAVGGLCLLAISFLLSRRGR